MQEKVAKQQVKEAKHETWREKQASRVLIQERDRDVLDQLEEAQLMMDDAIREGKASYEAKMEAQMECKEKIINERQHFWDKALRTKVIADVRWSRNAVALRRLSNTCDADALACWQDTYAEGV